MVKARVKIIDFWLFITLAVFPLGQLPGIFTQNLLHLGFRLHPLDILVLFTVIFMHIVCGGKSILKLLHPFLPFITEELWQYLRYPEEENHIINANFPKEKEVDTYLLENTEMFFQLITTIRKLSGGRKKEKNSNDYILVISNALKPIIEPFSLYLSKLTGINQIKFNREAPTLSAISFFIKDKECFYINPVAQKNDDKEKENIAKEIAYLSGFLTSINNKLTNENFLHRAKADIIEKELLKKKDVEGKLRILEANLKNL